MQYLNVLNEKQREAVEFGDGPILILAGAGSGKTRVLTHRIAHLIRHHKVNPLQIFAVTFTNKAADEMRHRVRGLLDTYSDFSPDEMWISTFHSACVRVLRAEIHRLDYSNHFTIYDDRDQLSLIKACMKELNVSENMLAPKSIQGKINRVKNEGLGAETYRPAFGGPFEDAFLKVFCRYTEALKQASALDFADLILLAVKLFQKEAKLLADYQERFRYLLIDEYQDTNRCQYLLMKLLAGQKANICAVGDEDQSIYRWRGADISNILNFEKDFPNAKVFKLEENYRSTKNIIEAASHVISNNIERRDKDLWTQNTSGEQIHIIECYDEHDEAHKVSSEILNSVSQDYPLNQIAVFYRTNAQSRVVEDMLRTKGIQYQIYGGLKFYDRLEVKDALAYLKLLANPGDDVSFRRIVNVPARGIGAVSLEKFSKKAAEAGLSHYELLKSIFGPEPSIDLDLGRSQKNFKSFFNLVEGLKAAKGSLLPSDLLNFVLEDSGYRKSLSDEQTLEAQSRLENLAELKQSMVEYELRAGADTPDKTLTLEGFLEEIALVSDIDRFDPVAPSLKMMTIHMAKGLEFDVVFIVGLEEELFPSLRTREGSDSPDVEEERRLFYVGMTRARKKLNLLYAKNRTLFGNSQFRVTSRFIDEIPAEYVDLKKADYFSRRRHYLDRPGLAPSGSIFSEDELSQLNAGEDAFEDADGLQVGNRVLHPAFGEGVVRQLLGADKLMVEFPGRGLKKISLKFTQLKSM